MTEYRYVGVADSVSFTEEDFTRHDISDQGEVTFDESNGWKAELSDGAYDYLRAQGFSFMPSDEYDSFLERRRSAEAAQRQAEVDRGMVAPSEAALAAEPVAPATPSVPERPAGATREQLAAHAWEHYQVDISGMKKGEMEAELDKLEAARADELSQGESSAETVPGDQAGEGQMGEHGAGTTAVPGTGTTSTQ